MHIIMKKLLYIIASIVLLGGFTACNKWLDVNTDPDSPNNESALVSNRLTWLEKFYMYSAGVTNYRTAAVAGVIYSTNRNVNTCAVTWNMADGLTTTPYQTWFTESGTNINDLYKKAEKEEAYHYMACARVFHVLGFMEMLDVYGEMPYTQALGEYPSPEYDDGKTIYEGCLAKLDEAIDLFGKTQGGSATPLAAGDFWNGGDVQKWIKLCNGLKARYLLKLSKKSDRFDPKAVLDVLAKGPQSNEDNTVSPCYNMAGETTDWLFGDPVQTNGNWDYTAYGSTQFPSKFMKDLLVNMRGKGIEDPRMSKIIPAAMCNIKLDPKGEKILSYDWIRSAGVDVYGDAERLLAGGPQSIVPPTFLLKDNPITYTIKDADERAAFVRNMGSKVTGVEGDDVKVTFPAGTPHVNSNNYRYAGDTVYVSLRNDCMVTGGISEIDMNWHFGSKDAKTVGAVGSTGSYQIRPNSGFEILTYYEMCFIKAEVLFRQGNRSGALEAYKAGIRAHMDFMQTQLQRWTDAGSSKVNPDMEPMKQGDINAYLSSEAVCQNAGELTMSDIMLQKYIAMGVSIENWNDMRRFNFSAGNIADFGVVYPGYGRSKLFTGQEKLIGTNPGDPQYWVRRFRLPNALELNYNATNVKKMNPHAYEPFIWSIPVWWDCATDDEYHGYLK